MPESRFSDKIGNDAMKRELTSCVINVQNVYQYQSITLEDTMNT